ncbi:hypothetical protein AaE_015814, partial [Aphanomyces astaci]
MAPVLPTPYGPPTGAPAPAPTNATSTNNAVATPTATTRPDTPAIPRMLTGALHVPVASSPIASNASQWAAIYPTLAPPSPCGGPGSRLPMPAGAVTYQSRQAGIAPPTTRMSLQQYRQRQRPTGGHPVASATHGGLAIDEEPIPKRQRTHQPPSPAMTPTPTPLGPQQSEDMDTNTPATPTTQAATPGAATFVDDGTLYYPGRNIQRRDPAAIQSAGEKRFYANEDDLFLGLTRTDIDEIEAELRQTRLGLAFFMQPPRDLPDETSPHPTIMEVRQEILTACQQRWGITFPAGLRLTTGTSDRGLVGTPHPVDINVWGAVKRG